MGFCVGGASAGFRSSSHVDRFDPARDRRAVGRLCMPNGSTSQTSAARSRPRAEGCNSPTGSCRLRSAAGSAKMCASARRAAADECVRSAGFDPNGSRFSAAGRSFAPAKARSSRPLVRPFASCCPKNTCKARAVRRRPLQACVHALRAAPLPLRKRRPVVRRLPLRACQARKVLRAPIAEQRRFVVFDVVVAEAALLLYAARAVVAVVPPAPERLQPQFVEGAPLYRPHRLGDEAATPEGSACLLYTSDAADDR